MGFGIHGSLLVSLEEKWVPDWMEKANAVGLAFWGAMNEYVLCAILRSELG